jgi:hypothetical protein
MANEPKCVPLPENGFFSEMMGITLSPDQITAYDVLEKQVSKMAEERFTDLLSKELRDSPPNIEMKPGATDQVAEDIAKVQNEMIAKNVSPKDQIKQLTDRFGASVEFKMPRGVLFTDEQLARKKQFQRQIDQMFNNMLTPDQKAVHDANLARRAQLEACEERPKDIYPSV